MWYTDLVLATLARSGDPIIGFFMGKYHYNLNFRFLGPPHGLEEDPVLPQVGPLHRGKFFWGPKTCSLWPSSIPESLTQFGPAISENTGTTPQDCPSSLTLSFYRRLDRRRLISESIKSESWLDLSEPTHAVNPSYETTKPVSYLSQLA